MVRSATDGPPGPLGSGAPRAGELAPGFPPFAMPYLPRFEEVHEKLSLYEGFVLLPVEVPSADVARVLAGWLSAQGRAVRVVAPSAGDWDALPADLVATPTAGGEVAVAVIGSSDVGADLRAGLRLLNQRRDTVAARLGAPLLWCGPRSFLDATWELAPDFWSVRELPIRIQMVVVKRAAASPPPEPRTEAAAPPEVLRELLEAATRQGDRRNAARLALRLAGALVARSQFDEAEALAGQAFATFDAEGERGEIEAARCLMVLGETEAARCLMVLGSVARQRCEPLPAEAHYKSALAIFERLEDMIGVADAARRLGWLASFRDDLALAETWYGRALHAAERADDLAPRANVLKARGDLRLRRADLVGAAQDYDQALKLFEAVEDRFGQANVLKARGDLAQGQRNLATAMPLYQQALELYEAVGSVVGQSNVLAEAALVLGLAAQPEQAREAAEQAAALAERAHNAYARQLAATVLASLPDSDPS